MAAVCYYYDYYDYHDYYSSTAAFMAAVYCSSGSSSSSSSSSTAAFMAAVCYYYHYYYYDDYYYYYYTTTTTILLPPQPWGRTSGSGEWHSRWKSTVDSKKQNPYWAGNETTNRPHKLDDTQLSASKPHNQRPLRTYDSACYLLTRTALK